MTIMASAPLLASILILTTFGGNNKPKSSLNVTNMQGSVPMNIKPYPSFRKKFQIYCRTGFRLVILPGGHVKGTVNSTIANKYGHFEFQSFGRSVIRIKNKATQRYIGISKTGRVFSTNLATNETLLKEHRRTNLYYSYHSYIYEDKKSKTRLYLAVKRNGRMKNARKVLPRHKSFQFLTIEEPNKISPISKIFQKFGIQKLFETLNFTRKFFVDSQ